MHSQNNHNILVFSQKGLSFRNEARVSTMKEKILKQQLESQAKLQNNQEELDETQCNNSSQKLLNDISVFLTRNQSNVSKDMSKKLLIAVQENNEKEQQKALQQLLMEDVDQSKRSNRYINYKVEDYSHKIVRNSNKQQSPLSKSVVYQYSPQKYQGSQLINTNASYDNSSIQSSRQRSLSPNLYNYKQPNKKQSQVSFSEDQSCNLYSPEKDQINKNNSIQRTQRSFSLQNQNQNNKRSYSNYNSSINSNNNSFNCDENQLSKKYSFIVNAENKIQKMIERYDHYDSEYQKIQRQVQNKRVQQVKDLEGSVIQSPDIRKHIENQDLLEVLLRQTNYEKRKQERVKIKQENKYGKVWKNLYLPKIPLRNQCLIESKQSPVGSQTIPMIDQKYNQYNKQQSIPNTHKAQSNNLYKKISFQIQNKN